MHWSSEFTAIPYTLASDRLGVLRGLTCSQTRQPTIHYFGGIPYALPPLGEYRFKRPRPLPPQYRYGTKSSPGNFAGNCAVCPQPAWRGERKEDEWDEDCLHLNVYIPAGPPPTTGWPVFFFIHGGFLQWGDANMAPSAASHLLSDSALRCIIVQPAYRLNAFGFLASAELQHEAAADGLAAGNMGFWDQRLALEWTHANIGEFGGNADSITLGGYSAGSYSTFQQLAHELYGVPDDKAIIKRAIMWSNGPGVQAKGLPEQQKQFDELLSVLGIPSGLSASEKLERLRTAPAKDIVEAQDKMKITEFRATTDGAFILPDSIARINSGEFARVMKRRGISLMNGECRDEHNLYRNWRTAEDSFEGVYTRLCADYPEAAVAKFLKDYCGSSKALPPGNKNWEEFFGHTYAKLQVYCMERGFHHALVSHGIQPGKDLLRYRIEWRAECCDMPPEWGVTHATDQIIWFWNRGLTAQEKQLLRPWSKALSAFINGEEVQWGTRGVKEVKRLRNDGKTDIWADTMWEEGQHVWKLLNGGSDSIKSRL